jgi:hypothetical protein
MKRSEMLSAIERRFPTIHMECNVNELLDFLEQQGMHPPTYAVSLDEDSRTHTTILMWEPENEE